MTVQDQINNLFGTREPTSVNLEPAVERFIRIQTGVVSRLFKEYNFYQNEANSLYLKVQDMKAHNACSHDVNHAVEVYSESRDMVPQVEAQLRTAREKLVEILHQANLPIDSFTDQDLPKVLADAIGSLRICSVSGDSPRCSTASPGYEQEDANGADQVSDTEY
jgi:tubulin-specific chaperone A